MKIIVLIISVLIFTPTISKSQIFQQDTVAHFDNLFLVFSSDWGDFDSDNDFDLLAYGRDSSDNSVLTIYRNDGNSNFVMVLCNIISNSISDGSTSWGDYDNDGDLDIILCGGDSVKILQNNGNEVFIDIQINLQTVVYGTADFVDYDNDGDLDIFLTGLIPNTYNRITKIYQNKGNGIFDETINLTGLSNASSFCGDYDNDGDVDVLVTGVYGNGPVVTFKVILYRNDGNNIFSEIFPSITNVALGSVSCGDYDNDGDLDLALTGQSLFPPPNQYSSQVYMNNGDNNFINIYAGLTPEVEGSVDWGDFDNDGDLDILVVGNRFGTKLYQNNGDTTFSQVYNHSYHGICGSLVDYDNDDDLDIFLSYTDGTSLGHRVKMFKNTSIIKNNIPSYPQNINSIINGNEVTLNWDPASDMETPTPGLSYNIRIGTTPLGNEVMSCHADTSSGYRRIVSIGNAQQNYQWKIINIPKDVYFWSVQSIDHAYAGSPFAPEQYFEWPPDIPTLVKPDSNSTSQSINILFEWEQLTGDVNHNLHVSDKIDFSDSTIFIEGIDTTYFNYSDMQYNTQYFWRVNAVNITGDTSGWSEVWNFTTQLIKPSLTSPSKDATNIPSDLYLEWNISDAQTYQIQLATDFKFDSSSIVHDKSGVSSTALQIINLARNTKYYWRVKAHNFAGNFSDWSEIFSFTTISTINSVNTTSFPSSPNRSDYKPADYVLFGLPGGKKIPINEVLAGSFGDDWKLFRDNGEDEVPPSQYQIPYNASDSLFMFGEGRGFWLLKKGDLTINRTDTAAGLDTSGMYNIPLTGKWNIITNPFTIPMSWKNILVVN